MKKSSVIVYNNNKYEIGIIIKKYRRNKTVKYDVVLERGVVLCGIGTSKNKNCYIDIDKSSKFAVDSTITDQTISNFIETEDIVNG